MRKLSAGNAAIVFLAGFGLGCQGLTVNLTASPDPADPGELVTWNVSVRNNTQCATTNEIVDLPPPLPDSAGAVAFIVGFVPDLDDFGAGEFCRLLLSCTDPSCITTRMEEALGPEAVAAFRARMQAATAEPPVSAPTQSVCQELSNTTDGVFALCTFDSLDPGETDTATFMTTAPDSGSRNAAQLAVAVAPAMGEDCRPGFEVGDDEWVLGGCFPLVTGTPAPALSPVATGAGAALLFIIGVVGLYRRRRS